jgi:hypothetical protein
MDAADRVAKIKAQRASQASRWFDERQRHSELNELRQSSEALVPSSLNRPNAGPAPAKYSSSSSSSDRLSDVDDNLLNKLTEKISDRLRSELAADMKKSQASGSSCKDSSELNDKLENYLASELHTHTCQICFELMMPPVKSPTLLFPCGHTFCKVCVDQHKQKSTNKTKCPYCRTQIESSAENVSLKQLIERFAGKKNEIESNSAEHLDDIFPASQAATSGHAGSSLPAANSREARKYQAEYNSCSMRFKILKNELSDSENNLASQVTRKVSIQKAKNMLSGERNSVMRKIEALKEELTLIEVYEREQENKLEGVEAEMSSCVKQIDLVKSTLGNLEVDLEKKKMLVLGVGGVVDEEDDEIEYSRK